MPTNTSTPDPGTVTGAVSGPMADAAVQRIADATIWLLFRVTGVRS